VAEDQLQRKLARQIATRMRRSDIVSDHPFDIAATVRCLHKVVAEFGGHDHGKMLVLGNGGDLFLGQGTERYTILE